MSQRTKSSEEPDATPHEETVAVDRPLRGLSPCRDRRLDVLSYEEWLWRSRKVGLEVEPNG